MGAFTCNEEARSRKRTAGASGVGYVDKSLYIHTHTHTYARVRNSPGEWSCGAPAGPRDASFLRIMDTRHGRGISEPL